MGSAADADWGEDRGPDPSEFMEFDKQIDDTIAWAKKSPAARAGHIGIRPLADY